MISAERVKKILRLPSLTELSFSDEVIERGKNVVLFYYLSLPFLAYLFFQEWQVDVPHPNFSPLWPLAWSHWLALNLEQTTDIVRFGFMATSLFGLLLYKKWYGRLIVVIGIWQAHALDSSFTIITHQWYVWLYTSLIFIFLPDVLWESSSSPEKRRIFLLVIWWAQATVMLVYTLAGMWKLIAVFVQTYAGQINGLSPYALSYQVADVLPKLQNAAPLAAFAINHPYIVWPAYVLVQYMQVFALWTMVRPSLQKVWAFELVVFHIGTTAFMGITFAQHIPLLLALFFASPFTPVIVSWKEIFFDLPIFGPLCAFVNRRLHGVRASTL